ncbi:MAG: hypothetical protein ACFFD4_06455 [Candidatus Odinarchaeota archaeon]
MADSTGSNIVAWISLATPTGLSVASVGTPGLRDDVEDQVLTGGLTAIQQILGSEIGASDDRFVGGSPSSRMGRFRIKHGEREIMAQYLLISSTGEAIPDPLLALAEEVCTNFSEAIVNNAALIREVEEKFMTLNILDTIDIFLDATVSARKKVKVATNDRVFDQEIQLLISSALEEHDFSPTLETITDKPKDHKDTADFIQTNRNKFINEFIREILALLCYKNPYPLLVKSKPADAIKRTEKLFEENMPEIREKTGEVLENVFTQVREYDLLTILKEFSIAELKDNKPAIRNLVEEHAMKRLTKNWPLLLLVNSELKHDNVSFGDRIASFVENIFAEYDLGVVLGKIATSMLGDEEIDATKEFIDNYVQNFTMNFPTGISDHGWKFIRLLLHLIEQKTAKTIEGAMQGIELTELHTDMINKKLLQVNVPKRIEPLQFYSSDDTISDFYSAVAESLTLAFQQLFNTAMWDHDEKKVGEVIERYAKYMQEFVIKAQNCYVLLNAINIIQQSRLTTNGRSLPRMSSLLEASGQDVSKAAEVIKNPEMLISLWEPENILAALKKQIPMQEEEDYKSLEEFVGRVSKEMNSFISQLTIFGNKSVEEMARGTDIIALSSLEVDTKNVFNDYAAVCKLSLDSFLDRTQEAVKEAADLAKIAAEDRKKSKDVQKAIKKNQKELEKLLESIEKKNEEVMKKADDLRKKKDKVLSKDIDKVRKDLKKIYSTFVYPPVKVTVTKNQEIKARNRHKLFPRICDEVIRKIEYDKEFPSNKYLISCLLSVALVGNLPNHIRKRGLELAIFNPKSSDILSMLLQEGAVSYRKGASINFDERLKELVEEIARKKTVVASLTIIETLREAYFSNPVKATAIKTENSVKYYANLGRFVDGLDTSWLKTTDMFGDVMRVQFINDIPHLLLEIAERPADKVKKDERVKTVSQVFGKVAWEETIEHYGMFWEFMRYSAAVLGTNKEKALHAFLEQVQRMMPF